MSTLNWEGNINADTARSNTFIHKSEEADKEFSRIMKDIKKACAQGCLDLDRYSILFKVNQEHLKSLGYKINNYSSDMFHIEW